MNLGGEGCSELRLHHCTVVWATELDMVKQTNKQTNKKTDQKAKIGQAQWFTPVIPAL